MGAGNHQAMMDTGIAGGTSSILRYVGHVAREERGMENDVILGVMNGKRRRGMPRTRWLDNVNNIK